MPIDLTPRMAGLLPIWWPLAAAILWAAALTISWRLRLRWPWLAGEVVSVGALALAHLLFFWRPLLAGAHVPRGGGDFASFVFPLHAFVAEQIQQGHFPLWNPHLHGGMPSLANVQAAMLYPPNLAAWALARPFSYGTLELMAVGHSLVASVGAYALARTLGMRGAPAVLAGIVFAYSGFLTAHLGHYSMLAAAVWLPLLLLATRQLALSDSWLWAVATAAVIFLATTAGHQQTLLYTLTATTVWWLFWVAERHQLWGRTTADIVGMLRERARPLLAAALRFGGAAVTAALVAAPMLLPSVELTRHSVRSRLAYEQATSFSVQPVALLQFVLPKAFGSNPTDYWGPFSSGEIWGYVGVVALVLAAVGLAVRPSRLRVALAAMVAVALLFALGPFAPLHGWAYRFVPFYDVIRAPARAYLFVDLGLALLAGFGLQEMTRGPLAHARLAGVLRASLRALVFAIAALVLFVIPLFYSLILGVNDPSNRPVIAVDGLNLLVLYLGGATLLLWAVARQRLSGTAIGLLAIGLVVLDLFGATATFNPTPTELVAGYRHPEAVAFLKARYQEDGPFRIDVATPAWQPNLATVVGLDDIGGVYDPMQPERYDQMRSLVSDNRNLPLYNLLGARYLIADAEAEPPGPAFREALRTADGLRIWENTNALPRAWFPRQIEHADAGATRRAVTGPDFDPRTSAYVARPDMPAGAGSAQIEAYHPDVVRLSVTTEAPATLVLADVDYPGWVARVDGQETPIATADGLFRAVAVPAGAHQVEFHFEPPLVRVGLLLSAVGIALGTGMMALGIWERQARRAGAAGSPLSPR